MTIPRPVYLVDGTRTPFLKARGKPNLFHAADLALYASRALLLRLPIDASELDEVIFGCVSPTPDEANIARIIALRLGCGDAMPAFTVQRNCASGMQALDSACRNITHGDADLILAGGTEAMSHAPLLLNPQMMHWLSDWQRAKSLTQKITVLSCLRPKLFVPVISLLRGLHDPVVGLTMGQTAENLAFRFALSREQLDRYAVQSHQRLQHALEAGYHQEITPLASTTGIALTADDGIYRETSVEKLAKLPPVFDQPTGHITAGNSAQISDGAACVLLASETAIVKHKLPILARIHPAQWAGVDPTQMGLGPVHAIEKTLQQHQLGMNNIDYWEINEAFAAQVLACTHALSDDDYCRRELKQPHALGRINPNTLNIDGGALSQGHPVGASGARIVLHLAHILQRHQASKGIASLCIGGGQGGAMLIEGVPHATK